MSQPSRQSELECKNCGERNPSRFEICWNCGKSLEDANRVQSSETADEDTETSDNFELETSETRSARSVSSRWIDWWELVAVLLVTIYPIVLPLLVGSSDERREITWDYFLLLVPRRIGMIVILWLLVSRDPLVGKPAPIRPRQLPSELLFELFILMADTCLRVAVRALIAGFGLPRGIPADSTTFASAAVKAAYPLALLVSAAYEETIFRVYFQSKLQKLLGGKVTLSIILAASLFAIVHGYTLRGTIGIFASGILLGTVYQISRSVPRLVLAHWMHNLMVYFPVLP